MKKIPDEILNKYIDGELSSEEKRSIEDRLLTDKDMSLRLSALNRINNQLRKMKEDEVSSAFTQKVMQRISKKYKVPKEQKLFISIIISFIGILCSFIVGYILINIAGELSETVTSGTSETVNSYLSESCSINSEFSERNEYFCIRIDTFNSAVGIRVFLL
jgi:hypothetical protein